MFDAAPCITQANGTVLYRTGIDTWDHTSPRMVRCLFGEQRVASTIVYTRTEGSAQEELIAVGARFIRI